MPFLREGGYRRSMSSWASLLGVSWAGAAGAEALSIHQELIVGGISLALWVLLMVGLGRLLRGKHPHRGVRPRVR